MEKKRRKEIKDKTRNNNFAAAFTYLMSLDEEKFGNQTLLAEQMKVDEDTITNILKCYTKVSEKNIAKLQKATGGIFNVHFLRGESDVMLAKDLPPETAQPSTVFDPVVAALLAAKDDIIREKDARITELQQHIADLRQQLTAKKGLTEIGRSQSERAE